MLCRKACKYNYNALQKGENNICLKAEWFQLFCSDRCPYLSLKFASTKKKNKKHIIWDSISLTKFNWKVVHFHCSQPCVSLEAQGKKKPVGKSRLYWHFSSNELKRKQLPVFSCSSLFYSFLSHTLQIKELLKTKKEKRQEIESPMHVHWDDLCQSCH